MSHQKYPQTNSASSTGIVTRSHKVRGSYTQVKAHAKQDRKRRQAYARQDKYDSLSLAEKLANPVLGKKERAKLEKCLGEQAVSKPQPATAPVAVEVKTVKVKKAKKVKTE